MPRRFTYYIVSERELSTLGFVSALGTAVSAFLGIFVGAAISLGLTLKTVDIPAGKTYLFFVAAFMVSLGASVILLVLFVITVVRAFLDARSIKTESAQEQRTREFMGRA